MSDHVKMLYELLAATEARAGHAEARADRAEARVDALLMRLQDQTKATDRAEARVDALLIQLQDQTKATDRLRTQFQEQADRLHMQLQDQTKATDRLRDEFKIQREADRAMVDRNLRGLMMMHHSTAEKLKEINAKNTKTLRVGSNRQKLALPARQWIHEDVEAREEELVRKEQSQRETTVIHFNHSIRKPTSKTSRKRTSEGQAKTNKSTITQVIVKVKSEVEERLQASGKVGIVWTMYFSCLNSLFSAQAGHGIRYTRRTIKYKRHPTVDRIVFSVLNNILCTIEAEENAAPDVYTRTCLELLSDPLELNIHHIPHFKQFLASAA